MHDEGLISCELEAQSDKPNKKIYSLTADGKQALEDWIANPVKINKVNDALLVKLYAGHLTDKQCLLDEIQTHRVTHLRMLQTFEALEQEYLALSQAKRKTLQLPYLTLRRGILGERAWLAWSDEVIAFLQHSN